MCVEWCVGVLLGVVDCLYCRPLRAEAKGANFKKKEGATQQLLAWCQHKTKYYEVSSSRNTSVKLSCP